MRCNLLKRAQLKKLRAVLGIAFFLLAVAEAVYIIAFLLHFYLSFWAFLFVWEMPNHLMWYWLFTILAALFFQDSYEFLASRISQTALALCTRVIGSVQKVARFLAIGMALLFLGYVLLILFREWIPFRIFFGIKSPLESSVIYVYLGLIPILLILDIKGWIKSGLVLLTIIALIHIFFNLGLQGAQEVIDSVELGEHNYHLELTYKDWANYEVILCDQRDLDCHSILYTYGGNRELVVNEALGEVYLFEQVAIQKIFGDKEDYSNYDYYVTEDSERLGEVSHEVWVLDTSKKFRLFLLIHHFGEERYVDVLPVRIYIDPESDFWKLVFDGREWGYKKGDDIYVDLTIDYEGEVSVYVDDILIYSYGSKPQCHVEDCEIFVP